MVTLLTERLPQQTGFQHQIRIYAGKIEEVGPHLTRYRIDGLIRIRKGIDKSLQRPPVQFVEDIPQRISL